MRLLRGALLALVVLLVVGLVRRARPAPPVRSIVLLPMVDTPLPELAAAAASLAERFPGLQIAVAKTARSVPAAAWSEERGQVMGEPLLELLAAEPPGTIAVLTEDLGSNDLSFLFGAMRPGLGRAVVSVARLRTVDGAAFDPSLPLDGPVIARAAPRLANQLTSSIAKLLGASFPCEETVCVLRYPSNVADLDAKGGAFCPRHADQVRALLAKHQRHGAAANP